MKEININIEGYNVNGICVGCLNYNRKMYYRDEVKECYKILGNIDVPDGLQIQVCWECLAAVRSVLRFRDQISKAFEILYAYSQKHTFLNSPKDFTSYACQRLSQYVLYSTGTIEPEVKNENDIIVDDIALSNVLKYEYQEVTVEVDETEIKQELEEDNFQDHDYSDIIPQEKVSSDDDIQLSKLKTKKKKRHKIRDKKKKNEKTTEMQEKQSRRLKNLPLELVELYTMSETEMLVIRDMDVASEEFQKLKYKCEKCVIGFNTKKLMECHQISKHVPKSENVYQCDVCKSYFLTKDNMSMHRRLHMSAYKCRQCELVTTCKRIMLKHECAARVGEGHTCTDCGKEFSTKSKLTYHKTICHQEKPQCDCCGKVFANKMTLKYHLKILPANKEDKPKEKLFIPCKGCDKVFHSKKSYRAHVVIHDGLTYPCPICGKLFQWKRNLARHTRNHREKDAGATHQCRECEKSFASRDCYNNHMRLSKRHVTESAYVHACHYCGKKFATKWCMVDHIDWDHLKRIKYQCSVCFKPFKTAKIMVAHMNNIHDGRNKKEPEGEHLCDICGKSYKTVKRLKGHVWAMHTKRTNAKLYKCSLCPATFAWQTSIYKHMKMMHDNKRTKPTRSMPMKKPETYLGMDTLQYFQPINVVQNIV